MNKKLHFFIILLLTNFCANGMDRSATPSLLSSLFTSFKILATACTSSKKTKKQQGALILNDSSAMKSNTWLVRQAKNKSPKLKID